LGQISLTSTRTEGGLRAQVLRHASLGEDVSVCEKGILTFVSGVAGIP
jgi:hypothetical protein